MLDKAQLSGLQIETTGNGYMTQQENYLLNLKRLNSTRNLYK